MAASHSLLRPLYLYRGIASWLRARALAAAWASSADDYKPAWVLKWWARSRATVRSVAFSSLRRMLRLPPGREATSRIHARLTMVARWMRANFFGSSFLSSSAMEWAMQYGLPSAAGPGGVASGAQGGD